MIDTGCDMASIFCITKAIRGQLIGCLSKVTYSLGTN